MICYERVAMPQKQPVDIIIMHLYRKIIHSEWYVIICIINAYKILLTHGANFQSNIAFYILYVISRNDTVISHCGRW